MLKELETALLELRAFREKLANFYLLSGHVECSRDEVIRAFSKVSFIDFKLGYFYNPIVYLNDTKANKRISFKVGIADHDSQPFTHDEAKYHSQWVIKTYDILCLNELLRKSVKHFSQETDKHFRGGVAKLMSEAITNKNPCDTINVEDLLRFFRNDEKIKVSVDLCANKTECFTLEAKLPFIIKQQIRETDLIFKEVALSSGDFYFNISAFLYPIEEALKALNNKEPAC